MPDFARLTCEQAVLLRDNRKRIFAAVDGVSSVVSLLLNACPHIETELPEECPVCRLYRMFADALNDLGGAVDAVDAALLSGPHPAAQIRKRRDGWG